MMLHVLIPFLACITSAVMAAVIFVRDSSHRGSRYGTVLIGGVAVWAMCEMSWNLQSDPENARFFLRLSGIGWAFIGPLALDLMREISGIQAPRITIQWCLVKRVIGCGFAIRCRLPKWPNCAFKQSLGNRWN